MGNGIFTRNYDNMVTMLKFPFIAFDYTKDMAVGETFTDNACVLKKKDGTLLKSVKTVSSSIHALAIGIPMRNIATTPNRYGNNYLMAGLWLGSDNTEEAYDDYVLGQELELGSSFSSTNYDLQYSNATEGSLTYNSETKCWNKTFTWTFIACRACTVGEMGFYINTGSYFSDSSSPYFLMYRKAFTTPYTLTTNQTLTLNFTMIIPANPNKPVSANVSAE